MASETETTTKRTRASIGSMATQNTPAFENAAYGQPQGKLRTNKNILFYIGILIFIAITGVAVYSTYELRQLKNPAYQQQALEKKTKQVIDKVSRIMELPEETPQLATVSDVDVLKKTQSFFVKAQNGDQVLVYSDMAILFRPSSNKIINVAPVNRTASTTTEVAETDKVKATPDEENPPKTSEKTEQDQNTSGN